MNKKLLIIIAISVVQMVALFFYILAGQERITVSALDAYFETNNQIEDYFESGNIIIEVVE